MRINPNFNQTITLYHRSVNTDKKESWQRSTIDNCFFWHKSGTAYSGTSADPSYEYICRIPFDDSIEIKRGDVIVLGISNLEIDGTAGRRVTDLTRDDSAFKVQALSDNAGTTFLARHYKAVG